MTAQLQLRADAGSGPGLGTASASMSRDSAGGTGGRWTAAVSQPVTLALAWTPAALGATLAFEQRLSTTATATNAWFRQGGGTVDARADFLGGSGLVGVRWLDAGGADLGGAVHWAWAHGTTPVPEPASALLLALGGGALLWAHARQGRRSRATTGTAAGRCGGTPRRQTTAG